MDEITPLQLSIFLASFISPQMNPYRVDTLYQRIIYEFVADGILIESSAGVYEVTDKGLAWLNMILAVPYPIKTWTDPRK